MSFSGAPAPSREEPIDAVTKLFRVPWLTWFRDVRQSLDLAPTQVEGGKVQLTGQTATIATTPIPAGTLAAGLYRVSYFVLVTTAAGVSSSVTVILTWTSNGVTQTWTGAAKNGNTTATYESSGPPLIHIDAGTPVSYALTYASDPAAAMVYELNLELSSVSLD